MLKKYIRRVLDRKYIRTFPFKLSEYNYEDFEKNPIVYHNFDYSIQNIMGRVIKFSPGRDSIQIEFNKWNKLFKLIKGMDVKFEVRPAYFAQKGNAKKKLMGLSLILDKPTVK